MLGADYSVVGDANPLYRPARVLSAKPLTISKSGKLDSLARYTVNGRSHVKAGRVERESRLIFRSTKYFCSCTNQGSKGPQVAVLSVLPVLISVGIRPE